MEQGQIFLYSTYFGSAFSSMRQQQKFDSNPFRSVQHALVFKPYFYRSIYMGVKLGLSLRYWNKDVVNFIQRFITCTICFTLLDSLSYDVPAM